MARTHGTASAYVNGHCRCDKCRQANNERHDRLRRRHGVIPRRRFGDAWEETEPEFFHPRLKV